MNRAPTLPALRRRITQATKIVAVFSLYLAVHGTLYALVIFGSRGHGGLMDGQQRRVVGVRALALVRGTHPPAPLHPSALPRLRRDPGLE